jgi:hypothetical protein
LRGTGEEGKEVFMISGAEGKMRVVMGKGGIMEIVNER